MYFLDKDQTKSRLREIGFDEEALTDAMASGFFSGQTGVSVVRTREFYNSFVAAKHCVEFFGDYTSCLLFVHSSSGRSSATNTHLFDRLRLAYGERSPPHLAPGHLFHYHDHSDLITFCDVAINGCFRAALVQHVSRRCVIFNEEDEALLVDKGNVLKSRARERSG